MYVVTARIRRMGKVLLSQVCVRLHWGEGGFTPPAFHNTSTGPTFLGGGGVTLTRSGPRSGLRAGGEVVPLNQVRFQATMGEGVPLKARSQVRMGVGVGGYPLVRTGWGTSLPRTEQ